MNYRAILLASIKRNSTPAFPSDSSLDGVDLDNEVIGAGKAKEFGGPSVHLFDNAEI